MKKFLSMILALVMSFTLLGAAGIAGSASSQEDYETPPEVAELLKLQERALEAYVVLRTTFTLQPDGSESYQDDFAGTWVDAPYLHIALTSDAPEVVGRYCELLKGYEDIVVYETAEYSLNKLNDIRFGVSKILAMEEPITKHYVDVIENKIVFELLEFDEKSINDSISSVMRNTSLKNTLPSELFIIKQGKPIVLFYDAIGGAGILSSYGSASLGICGTFKDSSGVSRDGFVTAGHALKINETLKYGSNNIGTVSVLNFGDNYVGDYALVRKTDASATLTNKVYSSSATTNITGTSDDLPINATFIKYGTEKKYGVGNVTSNNTSFTAWCSYDNIVGYVTTHGLTEGKLLSNSDYLVASGDSGGPIYVSGNFVGIITAGYDGGSKEIFFTPYSRFKHVFTPKTN